MTMLVRSAMTAFSVLLLGALAPPATAATISFTGDLRTDATITYCGSGCTLGPGNNDGEYAQYAAVIRTFNVASTSLMQGITFSYGGGINGAGVTILQDGLEPYLTLFDSGGNFIASTFSGTTCPPGALTNTGSGQCYDVLLDGGVLAPTTYQIALSAYLNMSLAENLGAGTLADGFTGLGNLAQGEDLHYAFDVVLTSANPVPEPTCALLLAGGLAICLFSRRRKGQIL